MKILTPHLFDDTQYYPSKKVDELVKIIIKNLSTAGVQKNRSVGLYLDTSIESCLIVISLIRLGCKVILIPLHDPKAVIKNWLDELDCTLVIKSPTRKKFIGQKLHVIEVSELVKNKQSQTHDKSDEYVDNTNNFSTIIKTSGTSASPKSALLSFRAHYESAVSVAQYFSLHKGSIFGLNLPLFHVSGFSIIMRSLVSGASIYCLNKKSIKKAVLTKRLTHLSLVPTQLQSFLDKGFDLSFLKALIIGGDALSADVKKRALKRGIKLYETYGLSETASMIYVKPALYKGQVLPHARIRLAVDNEIKVIAKSLFSGYIKKGSIKERQSSFKTGDIGRIDSDNELHIKGRKSNRIISGGENIQAEEIERIIKQYPGINACIVLGIPHKTYGMRLIALLEWAHKKNTKALNGYLYKHLPKFKIPDFYFDVPKHLKSEIKPTRTKLLSYVGSVMKVPT